MSEEGRVVVKTVERDHGGIYCFKCGKVLGKGQQWAEVRGGPLCGWQGCPTCVPSETRRGQ